MARRSKNAAVLDFFRTAPLDAVEVVYELVRDTVLSRIRAERGGDARTTKKAKKTKAAAGAPAPSANLGAPE